MEPNKLAQIALTRARELTDSERGAVFLVDEVTRQLYTKMADGVTEIRMPIKQGVAGWAASRGETVNIKNAYEDDRFDEAVDTKTGCNRLGSRTHQRHDLIVLMAWSSVYDPS